MTHTIAVLTSAFNSGSPEMTMNLVAGIATERGSASSLYLRVDGACCDVAIVNETMANVPGTQLTFKFFIFPP